jgi:hypothetical protein
MNAMTVRTDPPFATRCAWQRVAIGAGFALFVVLVAPVAFASEVLFGTRAMELLPPTGYEPARARLPLFYGSQANLYPDDSRLAEIYVTGGDIARLRQNPGFTPRRFFHVQALRAADSRDTDDELFAKVRKVILDAARPAMALNGPTPEGAEFLRLVDNDPNAIYFTSRETRERDGKNETVMQSSVIFCVDRQMLTLHAIEMIGKDPGDAARNWAEDAVREWALTLRNAAGMKPDSACGYRKSWFSKLPRGRAIDNFAIGTGILAVVVGLFRMARKRRRGY